MIRQVLGDCRVLLPTLPERSVQCVVTSPPYWGLRDYGVDGQLGLEATPEDYLAGMVDVFREVRRVLRDDGTLWVNMGDSYAATGASGGTWGGSSGSVGNAAALAQQGRTVPPGYKPKDLVGMPWRLAFALQADGWYLRSDIIYSKPNPMPESVTDRPTKAHEYVFLLSKRARYYYDADAVREPAQYGCSASTGNDWRQGTGTGQRDPARGARTVTPGDGTGGRNLRSVWTIPPEPTPDAHFATFPQALVVPCILAGTSEKGCCSACGAPWVRETTRHEIPVTPQNGRQRVQATGGAITGGTARCTLGSEGWGRTTTGWRPSCPCDAPPRPCVVLDPFAGTGTTGRVAERLGRDSILIELSDAYAKLADRKCAQYGLFASRA